MISVEIVVIRNVSEPNFRLNLEETVAVIRGGFCFQVQRPVRDTLMSINLPFVLGLCHLMCGRSLTFRAVPDKPGAVREGRSPKSNYKPIRWGGATTAHQAAEPWRN